VVDVAELVAVNFIKKDAVSVTCYSSVSNRCCNIARTTLYIRLQILSWRQR